jgi:hypothetical protein
MYDPVHLAYSVSTNHRLRAYLKTSPASLLFCYVAQYSQFLTGLMPAIVRTLVSTFYYNDHLPS